MRFARALAALFGAVIIAALTWAAPAQATTTPKVVTAITDVACGTATVTIVLADGVSGVYNARYYIDGDEAGKVPSTGTTLAAKTLTFDEDTSDGSVDLYVAVIDGPESDYRPKTVAAKVPTDCRKPAATPTAVPTVTAAPKQPTNPRACNPAYTGVCLTGDDVDCADLDDSDKPVQLADPADDPYLLDDDNDGVGCEGSEGSSGGDAAAGGGLPVTGVSVGGIAAVAGVLLAVGIGLRRMGRRRRTRYTA